MKDYFPPKTRNAVKMSALTTVIQYHTGSPSQGSKTWQGNEGTQMKRNKIFLLTNGMMAYIENPRNLKQTKKLPTINKWIHQGENYRM